MGGWVYLFCVGGAHSAAIPVGFSWRLFAWEGGNFFFCGSRRTPWL